MDNEAKKETDEKQVAVKGLGGHDADQFSSEGFQKESADDDTAKQDTENKIHEPDCEGRTKKLAGQCGCDRQSEFVDDKEYLASSSGGRSFKYMDEETDKKVLE